MTKRLPALWAKTTAIATATAFAVFLLLPGAMPAGAGWAVAAETPVGPVQIARDMLGRPVRTAGGVTVGVVTDVELREQDEPQIVSVVVQPVSPRTGRPLAGGAARLGWGDVVYQPRRGVVEIAMTPQEFAGAVALGAP